MAWILSLLITVTAAQLGRAAVAVAHLSEPKLVSVVVPVLNEEQGIVSVLQQEALKDSRIELIIVDGGSDDRTVELVRAIDHHSIKLITSNKASRAAQMNAGADRASAPIILFLHADTYLPDGFVNALDQFLASDTAWGRFDVSLDDSSWPFLMIGWFINHRSRLTGIATGDQAIFVKKDAFRDAGGFPRQKLMEDVELSSRLKKITAPYCVSDKVSTSARKWQKEGVLKTVLLMWRLRLAYFFGAQPDSLAKKYYS